MYYLRADQRRLVQSPALADLAPIRTLDERFKAARSNLRFQNRRLADLEARIADPAERT
jgi:hypothetical protein